MVDDMTIQEREELAERLSKLNQKQLVDFFGEDAIRKQPRKKGRFVKDKRFKKVDVPVRSEALITSIQQNIANHPLLTWKKGDKNFRKGLEGKPKITEISKLFRMSKGATTDVLRGKRDMPNDKKVTMVDNWAKFGAKARAASKREEKEVESKALSDKSRAFAKRRRKK